MIAGFDTLTLASVGIFATVGAMVLALAYFNRTSETAPEPIFQELDAATGSVFQQKPAPTDKGMFGYRHLKQWNRKKKRKKALKKGYVRWHLVGDSISEERLVKPEYKEGGNIPELEYKDNTYLFPPGSLIPSAEDGVYVAMHRVGEAEPIDLRNGNDYSIGSNTLKEYLTMRVTATSPGIGIPGLGNLSTRQIIQYGIIGLVAFFILAEVVA